MANQLKLLSMSLKNQRRRVKNYKGIKAELQRERTKENSEGIIGGTAERGTESRASQHYHIGV